MIPIAAIVVLPSLSVEGPVGMVLALAFGIPIAILYIVGAVIYCRVAMGFLSSRSSVEVSGNVLAALVGSLIWPIPTMAMVLSDILADKLDSEKSG